MAERFYTNEEFFDMMEALASLNRFARALKSDLIREKTTYEADPQNQADKFAFHVNLFQIVLNSLQREFDDLLLRLGDSWALNQISLILDEVKGLISEHWSTDLEERVQRHRDREIRKVVEHLSSVNISENHVNENVMCTICLSAFEAAEEVCQLRCHEQHIFHKECIVQWLKKKNECPMCRRQAYKREYWTEIVGTGEIETLRHAIYILLFVDNYSGTC